MMAVRKGGIIVAADVEMPHELSYLVRKTCDVDGVAGYKVGAAFAIRHGLPKAISLIREDTKLPIIYDHQKGGTDVPKMGAPFISAVKDSGADAAILFPLTGQVAESAWIDAAKKIGLDIIVGGMMSHDGFTIQQGGFVSDQRVGWMYTLSAAKGVDNFVMPGNYPELISHYVHTLDHFFGGSSRRRIALYLPGFSSDANTVCKQIRPALKAAAGCNSFYPIIGSAIHTAKDPRLAALKISSMLKVAMNDRQ